jgi:tRNA pseudouridine55 synthase
MLTGFINVLKPCGATASDVVVKLRKILGERKIGHLGTLDPGAVGVLPIAVGNATKLFDLLTNKQKTYRAFFTFGKTTDTLDSYGQVVGTGSTPCASDVLAATKAFLGNIEQIPPIYSAISVGGVRSYDLARSGKDVQLKKRSVTIFAYDFVSQLSDDTYVFDITCSGGTYIRSLARDLAESVGTVGYMSGLIRLNSGCFDIDNALTLDEIELLKTDALLPITYPLDEYSCLEIDEKYYVKLLNGVRIDAQFDGLKKIYCKGELFGLYECVDGKLVSRFNLRNA